MNAAVVPRRAAALRVMLDVPERFCRPRNTDWRYVRFDLVKLPLFAPEIQVLRPGSVLLDVGASLEYVLARMAGRQWMTGLGTFPESRACKAGANVIFSHRQNPPRASTPVVWQHAILDPNMQTQRYGANFDLRETIREMEPRFSQAQRIIVSTEAEAKRHSEYYPRLKGRWAPIPFFLPALRAVDDTSIARHQLAGEVRILFVGNEARRKGLCELLHAFLELPRHCRVNSKLIIVSTFADGKVVIPTGIRAQVFAGGLPHGRVLELMREAHVLVNVSRFESFGISLVEGMSQGMCVLGPNWEVQREILDNGGAGVNVASDHWALADTLAAVIEDPKRRELLAQSALRRFRERYAPEVVAGALAKALSVSVR